MLFVSSTMMATRLTLLSVTIAVLLLPTVVVVVGRPSRRITRSISRTSATGLFDKRNGRLPTTLRPYHYNLEIFPYIYLAQPPFSFTGKVSIWFDCVNATDVIAINNNGPTVDDVSLSVSADSLENVPDPVLLDWTQDRAAEVIYFYLVDKLLVGARYVLSLSFAGTMNSAENGRGLYWDYYLNELGHRQYLAATQLESISAREMFPCFDEPEYKATFNTTIVCKEGLKALSNTPVIDMQRREFGWLANVYATTPLMSTYLVAIVVGDFADIFSGNINGYDVRLWARPQIIPMMSFAANISGAVQAWLEGTTLQRYPIGKMDHIALPGKYGAMENWGMITYSERSLYVDKATSTITTKLDTAALLSHEISHQWYGDLVTCKWWDDAWLNEGFATYYRYHPFQSLRWKPFELQQIDLVQGSMMFLDVDARNNSDPVRKQVTNLVLEMSEVAFTGSTYPKGAAILRMISGILTEQIFEKGLARYLESSRYTSVTTDDLWEALNIQAAENWITNPDGSALNLKSRMDPWLNQMGYPLVTVTRGDGGKAVASRTHFLNPTNQIMFTASKWNYAWDVPITVVTSQSTEEDWDAPPVAWIDIDQTETTLTGLPTGFSDWFMLNSKGKMFYRVNYDEDSRKAIINQLQTHPRAIDAETKATFIDDTFTLSKVGLVPAVDAMAATTFLADEFTYNPWFPAVKHLLYISRLLARESWYNNFREYVLSISQPVYDKLGWSYHDDETPLEQLLRRDMISMTCGFGGWECLNTAKDLYYVARNDTSKIDPNNLPIVLCDGIATFANNWEMWMAEYLNRSKKSEVKEERYAYLFGLACTDLKTNLNAYLSALIGPDIPSQDKNTASRYLALNDIGAVLLWDYLDNNWASPAFSDRFTVLTIITRRYSSQSQLDQLNDFIARHPATSQEEINSYAQMILSVEQNIRWMNNNAEGLKDWLVAKNQSRSNLRPASPMIISPAQHWIETGKSKAHMKSNYDLYYNT